MATSGPKTGFDLGSFGNDLEAGGARREQAIELLANMLILAAHKKAATAIWIHVDEGGRSVVDLTIGGDSRRELSLPVAVHDLVVARLAAMAGTRLPRPDHRSAGEIHLRVGGQLELHLTATFWRSAVRPCATVCFVAA